MEDFGSFFERARLPLYRVDGEGRFAHANAALVALLGHAWLGDLLTTPLSFVDSAHRARFAHLLEADGRVSGFQAAVTRADGSAVWVSHAAWPIEGGFEGSMEPIPDRPDLSVEDAQVQRFLSSIIENLPNMIFMQDARELRFVLFNRAGEELLGYKREQLLGCNDYDFFPRDEADFFTAKDRAVLDSGELLDIPEETIHTSKGVRVLHTKKIPIIGSDGRPHYLLGVSEDVTARKEADQALRKARDEAQAANRAKSEFLANMSHEIRTPMNGVIGLTDLLLETPVTAEQREYLQAVRTSAHGLLGLIDDILDFSRIEAGRFELRDDDFSLRDVVTDTVKALVVRAEARGLEMNLVVAPEVPDGVTGDPWRLRQILVNLLGNAIKFTEHGEIVVRVGVEPCDDAQSTCLHFCVADTGIGIPPEKLTQIFDPFVQADTSNTRRHGGAGLGLAISSRLVVMMGGRLWGETPSGLPSRTTPGAAFHFTVRLRLQAPAESAPDPHAALAGCSVLVVDDHPLAREQIGALLDSAGISCFGVATAAAAHDAAAAARFDCAVVDARLEAEDGFDVARTLIEQHRLPVVMVLTPAEMRRFASFDALPGQTASILKPPRRLELLRALAACVGTPAQESPPPVVPAVDHGETRVRVLVVEDNPINQMLAHSILERWHCEVAVEGNGRDALRRLESEAFDVVLLDVQMPVLDGIETARAIRAREAQAGGHLPIIALTARAMKGDRERCLDAGMDEYVAKPFQARQVLAALRRVLPGRFEEV